MAEQKDRDISRDHRGRDVAAPPPQRSARRPTATAADIDRVLGAIGGLSDQLQAIGERTAAAEIRIDELGADLGDMREAQEAQAKTVASLCSRAEKVEAALAEALPFEDIVARLRVLEERPPARCDGLASDVTVVHPEWTHHASIRRSDAHFLEENLYEADPTIIRLVADKQARRGTYA